MSSKLLRNFNVKLHMFRFVKKMNRYVGFSFAILLKTATLGYLINGYVTEKILWESIFKLDIFVLKHLDHFKSIPTKKIRNFFDFLAIFGPKNRFFYFSGKDIFNFFIPF